MSKMHIRRCVIMTNHSIWYIKLYTSPSVKRVYIYIYIYIYITCIGVKNPSGTNYYYDKYRYQFHYGWPSKKLSTSLPQMKLVDMEDRPSTQTAKAKSTGFTGLSILHRLHALYGFDVLYDLVFDAMHNIPLNVASHHLHYYFNEGILSAQEVDRRLKAVQWTPGIVL